MSELKEYNIPESRTPIYNEDFTELCFSFPCTSLSGIEFKNYLFQIMENQHYIINQYIIINGKELNEEEIQTIVLTDVCEDDKEKCKTNFHIKVLLNHSITPTINFPILYFTRVIKQEHEIKFLS